MAGLIKRGNTFYVVWYVGKKEKRRSLRTDSLQIAKEKLRKFESAQVRGDDLPLPTRTSVTEILTWYVEHVRTTKTAKMLRRIFTISGRSLGRSAPPCKSIAARQVSGQ